MRVDSSLRFVCRHPFSSLLVLCLFRSFVLSASSCQRGRGGSRKLIVENGVGGWLMCRPGGGLGLEERRLCRDDWPMAGPLAHWHRCGGRGGDRATLRFLATRHRQAGLEDWQCDAPWPVLACATSDVEKGTRVQVGCCCCCCADAMAACRPVFLRLADGTPGLPSPYT